MKVYRNPFDEQTEKYSKMFDTYFEHREVEKTKLLIKEIEMNLGCFDDLSRARLSYSLGTAYADIMHLSQYNEECLKKCIYYYSCSIEVLEKAEIKEENKPYIYPLMMNLYVNYGNAYFINSYYRLGIPERKVNFKSIWKEEKIKRKLDIFENFMLNALYWMSKEIYSYDNFSTNPLAEEIDIIRNHLEHKYVKIYSEEYGVNPNGEDDPLVKYISEEKLEKMTMYLMKLVKEIIIYLSLLVNIEENKKEKREKVIEKRFDICRDEWKM